MVGGGKELLGWSWGTSRGVLEAPWAAGHVVPTSPHQMPRGRKEGHVLGSLQGLPWGLRTDRRPEGAGGPRGPWGPSEGQVCAISRSRWAGGFSFPRPRAPRVEPHPPGKTHPKGPLGISAWDPGRQPLDRKRVRSPPRCGGCSGSDKRAQKCERFSPQRGARRFNTEIINS